MGLPWFRADTNLSTHDKILGLAELGDKGLAAAFVYFGSIGYCNGHETEGFVRKAALPFVHGKPTHVRLLVDARLWVPVDGGWRIHNWGNRNLVGASAQVLSEIAAEKGRKGAQKRWHDNDSAI